MSDLEASRRKILVCFWYLLVVKLFHIRSKSLYFKYTIRNWKTGRFEKLLGFATSHSILTRGSVSLSRATTPNPYCFSKSKRYIKYQKSEPYFCHAYCTTIWNRQFYWLHKWRSIAFPTCLLDSAQAQNKFFSNPFNS